MNVLKLTFLTLVARPIAAFFTGADVVGRQHLPTRGPAIIAANHQSHVDTLLLLTIFPAKVVARLRPVAAADYFLRGPLLSWFSEKLIGIVPIERHGTLHADVLGPARAALAAGDIVIIFPEGTRGPSTDDLAPLRAGVAHLAAAFPDAPVTPVWIEGAGRVLPKGAVLPAPMNCTVLAGPPVAWSGDRQAFLDTLRERLEDLRRSAPPQRWLQDPDPDPPPPADAEAPTEPPPRR